MNRFIHRSWGEGFVAIISLDSSRQNAVDKPVFILSIAFLGDKSWKGNLFRL